MDLMVDIETLGSRLGSVILQIGLVAFDPHGKGPAASMKVQVCPDSCFRIGMVADWSTIHWWIGQGQAARASLPAPGEGQDIAAALERARGFYLEHRCEAVWSHGRDFDIPLIEWAANRAGVTLPWKFYDHRCTRTLGAMVPGVARVRPETAHDALSDALAQAQWVQDIFRDLGDVANGAGEEK